MTMKLTIQMMYKKYWCQMKLLFCLDANFTITKIVTARTMVRISTLIQISALSQYTWALLWKVFSHETNSQESD